MKTFAFAMAVMNAVSALLSLACLTFTDRERGSKVAAVVIGTGCAIWGFWVIYK